MITGLELLIKALGPQEREWQTCERDRIILTGIAGLLRPGLVVEIGIHQGGFTHYLSHLTKQIYCIDPNKKFESLPVNTKWFPVTSDVFFEQNPDLRADMIIVDGDHGEEQAYRDLNNSIHRSRFVLLHDTILAFTRRGYSKAITENKDNLLYSDLEVIQPIALEYNPLRMELCGGLGMVVTK
jgi:hypothetical protein